MRGGRKLSHLLWFLCFVASTEMSANSIAAHERFSVRLSDGSVLFDEDDVEQYVSKTSTFILSVPASQRLVTNWDAFVKNDEGMPLVGTLPNADNHPFVAMLGTKKLVSGTVAGSPMTLYSAASGAILLYGDMPLMVDRHVHIGIGKFRGDLKVMIESGSEGAFSMVLTGDIATHFRALNKLTE